MTLPARRPAELAQRPLTVEGDVVWSWRFGLPWHRSPMIGSGMRFEAVTRDEVAASIARARRRWWVW